MHSVGQLFVQRLGVVDSTLELLNDLVAFGALPSVPAGAETRLHQRVRGTRDWEGLILDGCVLIMAAQFELAVRDMVETLVVGMASKVPRYVDLPQDMRKNNVKLLGRVMADSDRGRFAHIAYAQAVSDLSVCLHAGIPVNLFATGFAITDRNMTSTEVADLARRAEVKELWPQVSRDSALNLHLGFNTPSQLSVEAAKRKLDGFMEYRNQIVHRGPNYQVAGPSVVKDYAEYFRVLVPAVAQVLEDHLAAFP